MAGKQLTRPRFADAAGAIAVAAAQIQLSSTDRGTQSVEIATLPAGAVIVGAWVEVEEAGNDSGADVVTVGWDTAEAGLVSTVTEGTPGIYAGVASFPVVTKLAAAKTVKLYYTTANSDATAGRFVGYVAWFRTADNG